MTIEPARLRPGVVVAQDVRGLTGEQMVAAHAFVELHTLRSSGYCTCGFKVPLFGYRDHLEAESSGPGIIQGSASRPDIGADVQPAERQLVDDVVRDLVSRYPGTIQSVNLPTPDTALVRLHRGRSTWLVSVARLEVSDAT